MEAKFGTILPTFAPMLTFDLTHFPVLTTERLVLRALRVSDVEEVFALRADPAVMQHVNRPLATSLQDAEALIATVNDGVAANTSIHWAITRKGDDRFIGLIGFWRIVKEHDLGELGYMLARAHWGQGLTSEAIAAVLPVGFGTLGMHRVEAITRPVNRASIRALEKNGFVQEATLRDAVFFNGAFHDSMVFGRLAEGAAPRPA